jgi:hypothetical protein
MPVRKEGDFQRKSIASWDTWIEEAITEAQERGEFDNLPDAGKPIKLEDSPFAPDMASALRTLKNAGYEPTWMELDRAITLGKEDMQVFLERSAAYLKVRQTELLATPETGDEPAQAKLSVWSRLKRFLSFASDLDEPQRHPLTVDDLVLIRSRMRDQYLQRAAAVDKKITEFHAALPRNLWHLERVRITPEQSARNFDKACPPIAGNG